MERGRWHVVSISVADGGKCRRWRLFLLSMASFAQFSQARIIPDPLPVPHTSTPFLQTTCAATKTRSPLILSAGCTVMLSTSGIILKVSNASAMMRRVLGVGRRFTFSTNASMLQTTAIQIRNRILHLASSLTILYSDQFSCDVLWSARTMRL